MSVALPTPLAVSGPRSRRRLWRAAALAVWFCGGYAVADETMATPDAAPTDYVQAWLGALRTDDRLTREQAAPDDDLVGGLGTLPLGGGSAQRLWGQGAFRIGYEGGGLVSWKNHDTEFFAASDNGRGTLVVTTENTFLSVGVFMGAVASLQLTDNLRVQLAAGPALTWARLSPDDAPEGDTGESDAGDDASLVPYGRVGLEVEFGSGFMVGASVRYADDEFDFGRSGRLEVDEVMWLLTLGSRL